MRPYQQKIACKTERRNVEQTEQTNYCGGHDQTDEHEQKIEPVEPGGEFIGAGRHGWRGFEPAAAWCLVLKKSVARLVPVFDS